MNRSVGAWTLAVFSSAVGLAVVCHEIVLRGYANDFVFMLQWVGEAVAMLTGLILLSYTSVLLCVSAIPVWSENRRLLPPHFVASALGGAASILELLGLFTPATNLMILAAAATETLIGVLIEVRRRPVDAPLRDGRAGWFIRAAETLAGPVTLLLRIFWGHSTAVRLLASACFILGALLSRYGWLAAGRASSRDPEALFDIQRRTLGRALAPGD